MKEISDKGIFYLGLVIAAVCAAGWILYVNFFEGIPGTGCAFKNVTGFYCPGCGGTRAVKAFFSGHFIWSFIYHPFVPYCFIMWIIYEGSYILEMLHIPHIKGMRFRTSFVWTGLIILFGNWIIKNILLLVINL